MSGEDFHRRRPSRGRLDQILVVQETRTLSNDWVVHYRNRLLQFERPSGRMPARSTVQVCEARDGTLTIRHRDRALPWREPVPGAAASAPGAVTRAVAGPSVRVRGPRAAADHPWRRRFVKWGQERAELAAAIRS